MRMLLVLLILLCPGHMAWAAKRVALVIGNDAYSDAPALANPVADATAIAKALTRLDFDVIEGTDLDISGMRAKIRAFARKMEGAEMALFFYAGHGVQVAGQNYLLPTDAVLERESDLDFAAVNVDLVVRQMDRAAETKIVLLDACRNNPFRSQLSRSMGATRSSSALSRGLAPIRAEGGALIGFATDPGDVAFDGDGQHSPFTQALLEHIETPGLEINVMMTRVRADVYSDTNKRQRPWTTSSLIGEVYLNAGTLESAAPGASADLELAFWNAIADSDNPADYDAYLQQFPAGTFAPLARNRLAELTLLSLNTATEADPLSDPSVKLPPSDLSTPREEKTATISSSDPVPQTAEAAGRPEGQTDPSQSLPRIPEPEDRLATARVPEPRPEREDPAPVAGTSGEGHRDCALCPEMVAIPGGTFRMGSKNGEATERPVREVTIAPFMMSRAEISVSEFGAVQGASGIVWEPNRGCYAWTPRGKMRFQSGFGHWDTDYWSDSVLSDWDARGRTGLPVACVSFSDAEAYVSWLNTQVDGHPYRLASEAEFEYALRAGTQDPYPWGDDASEACKWANGADADARFGWRNRACSDGKDDIALSGTFPANAFGLHDMLGNLWEWTADCWNASHKGAPEDGRARTTGNCKSRVVRGGSWDDPVANLRSAYRVGIPADRRQINVGFRVVRDPLP